jgi:hypothetical protein
VRIVEQEQLLAFISSPFCSRVRVAQSLAFFVLLFRHLFVSVSFFFWPLYCLSFFALWLLITLFVSSNFSKLTTFVSVTYRINIISSSKSMVTPNNLAADWSRMSEDSWQFGCLLLSHLNRKHFQSTSNPYPFHQMFQVLFLSITV